MLKLIMTKGLPASGKSTWAKQEVAKSGGTKKRVNKDDLRDMIDAGKWGSKNEKHILAIRDGIIKHYLYDGFSVIVDDTNLAPKHEATLREIAKKYGATFQIVSFLDVPLKTCIERDLKRPMSVGQRVIQQMYDNYLKPELVEPEVAVWNPKLPTAILCDIDGTIAHMTGRSPFDWDRVDEDVLDRTVAALVTMLNGHAHVIFMSGRSDSCRTKTELWLAKHGFAGHQLYMRPDGDNRKDSIVKAELYEQNIKGKYNVMLVLDDRNQVVDMWRSKGLKCLQVAEGNF